MKMQLHIYQIYPPISKKSLLEKIKEIMSKRNIKVSLEQAREWYKEGGKLRELALQAFSKQELMPKQCKPRNWDEFVDFKRQQGELGGKGVDIPMPTVSAAKSMTYYHMLMNLIVVWRGNWKPNWADENQKKWCICCNGGTIRVEEHTTALCPLSFPTEELAVEFLKCFEEELKGAVGLF